MDHLIHRAIWRWAKRRHPNKRVDWVRKKYFHSVELRNWVFAGMGTDRYGVPRQATLYTLADTPIRRHQKVKGSYNPFDPADERYGETLRQQRLLNSKCHRKQWLSLYQSQAGRCALCQGAITQETNWENHHIIYRSMGGPDTLANRVLLHPVCHIRVHQLGLKVVKPAPSRVL